MGALKHGHADAIPLGDRLLFFLAHLVRIVELLEKL